MSGEGTSEREPQVDKITSRLRKYSKDEFKDSGRLGAGGFAEVRKCDHNDLKMVAIKTFNITGDDKKITNTWDMINREANVLSRFQHENIVKVLGIIEWPNAVGIIMEYVDGENLETLLCEINQSDVPWDTRLNIAQGVISALSYIHNYDEKKIYCHGDIKPGNILLTKKLVVKLADFGSAALQRATGAPNTTSEITPTKQHTMLYVAPEFLKDIRQSKNSTMDMYSFGSVLYELITRKPPYHGCGADASFLRELITSGERPDMKLIGQTEHKLQTDRDRSIFDLLNSLMLRCWNNDPTSRPESKTVKEELDSNIKKPQQNTSYPDQKTEWANIEAAAHAMYQEKDVGAHSSKNNQHLKCDVTPALIIPQASNSSTLTSPLKKELGFTPSFSNSSKNIRIAANFLSGTPVVSSIPPAPALVKLTHQDESASPPTSSVLQSSLGNDKSSTAFDSVSPPTHAQSSKQEISETTTSKPENPTDKFSNDIRQYPKDELKELNKEDIFIGSGGYGDVRKYEHEDKVVAVKEFAVKGDEQTIDKMWKIILREANILCCFHHENIVEILGSTQWDKGVGIVMEYVDGGNLHSLLSKSELSWNTRLEIAKGIVSGLEYIHNYGDKSIFCHGDLRPENVLLTKALQVKLADFVSAAFHRVTAASSTSVHKVPPKQMILVYVAPEFLEDNTLKRNPAMDMYSFGMVLYELISRKAPYSDYSMPMAVPGLILDEVKPSEKFIEDVGAQLKSDDDRSIFSLLRNVMEKCCNIDSDLRPKSKTVKQELSGEWMNAIKFSNDIRQYSKDEFKARNKEDSVIGSGSYGDVRKYELEDKVVAIKEFAVEGDVETTSQIWKIILREANILCCFHHENIVEILGVTQWDKGVGIVMEYVDGGNLHSLLSKSELSWNTRLEIAKGIVSGLEYIHNYGDKTIFCHAAFYDGSTSAPSTSTSHIQATTFTVIYVAPEFLEDNTLKRNPAMDMYSFGMALYMLICTKAPYSGCSMPMLVSGLILGGIKPSKQLIEEAESQLISDDDRSIFSLLRNLMEKCWNKDPASRPSSKTVKQALSVKWMNVNKFSNHVREYSKDEFKVRNKEDSFIGSGGYGDVRKYDHKDQVVAIKEFSVKGDEKMIDKMWKMVLREANILCRFDHENIVKILGITQWEKGVGIIMEFVEGGNLQTLLAQDNQPKLSWQPDLSWKTRLEIAKGITSGLEYIHNYGEKKAFCHGDLKPANILLTQSLQVKLADIGSAAFYRATGASATTIDVVSTTQFTLVYAAPEFLEDNTREKNPAMDMYSFGMVFYELISGKAPYSDCSMPGQEPSLIVGGIKPTQKLIDEAESRSKSDDDRAAFTCLKNLMERCWNSDPASRPSSKTVKQVLSGEWKNVDKFSNHVRQYSKDEFKVRNKEDSFIGSGGYADVRKYDHKDQVVAIKEFAVKGDEEMISQIWKMVLREANILCRFDHENIVKILGITQWEKGVGIIMEIVDGGNLQTLLAEDNQPKLSWQPDLSWKTRLEIAKGITSGLEYIHNYGDKKTFCHGDLKPANVLLTQSLQVKLADFGSAAFYRATGASDTTISHVSSKQFTLIYVAPEFLEDNTKRRMPSMDMYSFGMVLYELISGKPPYSDCSMPNFLPDLISAKIKPSEKLIKKAENQLKSDDDRSTFKLLRNLMKKCCDKDPTLRPSSKEVKQELSGDGMNQQQSSSSPIPKPQKDGVDAFASKRKSEAAPTMKKITRHQAAKMYTPKSNIRQIWSESERYLTVCSGIFSPKSPSSRVEAKSDEASYVSGSTTLLAGKKTIEDFLEAYQNVLLKRNFKEAKNCLAALRSFHANDVKATAEDIRLKAVKLQDEEKYLQSIALFDTAATLFAKLKNPVDDLERIQYCIQGMKQANEAMVEKDRSTTVLVKEHVIPLMRNWVREMKGAPQVSEKWKCHSVSWALSNIEGCELMVGQMDERKQTLEEAVNGMREVFGSDVYKQQGRLFGNLVDHLAGVYNDEFRFDEANDLYEEALEAREAAEDYFGDEEDRKDDIRITNNNLRKNLKDIWEKQMRMY